MRRKILSIILSVITITAWAADEAATYAGHSVLRSGSWAKIQVWGTGIRRLTNDVIRRAGFSDMSKVRIYGYGGALVPETLTQDYIASHDDLQEIPTCTIGGEKYFMAQGSVSWSSAGTTLRTRNPYYDYGCYFITEGSGEPLTTTEEELLNTQKNDYSSYHYLYEKDQYAWHQIGRNLVELSTIENGETEEYQIIVPKGNTSANFRIVITAQANASYTVKVGGSFTSSASMKKSSEYDKAVFRTITGAIKEEDLTSAETNADGDYIVPVQIACTADGPIRLDYIAASFDTPYEAQNLGTSYDAAEYVYNISNQDHHADEAVDMLIIIPTSQNVLKQAEALAELHRVNDGMTVRIVPADELYNEFSSGTPDVSAYRRYLKMYYDKDQTEDKSQTIKTCLLFGDCVWDNRMITLNGTSYNPDNYLLAYHTENSYNTLNSIVSDDFIGILQDNQTIHADGFSNRNMRIDVAVGRLPAANSTQAQAMVNKITHYVTTSPAGAWQNEMMFIGDDSDNNSHMRNINANADDIRKMFPGYEIKKVMFDAYEKTQTSTGEQYADVETLVNKQIANGALVMNYGGHASETQLADEKMLLLADFKNMRCDNYPLWFTAACETMPFSSLTDNIGKTAILNADGAAVAFVGTAGTVLEEMNSRINKYFMRYVLSFDDDDQPVTIGEALRRSKNSLIEGTDARVGTDITINKHHYQLLGDPAMRLALPQYKAVVDEIDGQYLSAEDENIVSIKGNSIVTVKGHITDRQGNDAKNFNGTARITVKDSEQTITCRDQTDATTVFTFLDYDSKLFSGTCNVVDGEFSLTFHTPIDIHDDGNNGLITIYARDATNAISANGETKRFKVEGLEEVVSDGVGPAIYAYLNTPAFTNGAAVGYTPYFVAEITDKDGINVVDGSIGHNLELTIDNDATMTYDLNANFVFEANSYESGQTYYVLPALSAGYHTLSFRAWDLLNNSSTVSLNFYVTKGLQPTIDDISVSPNPITSSATFYVTHDMQGSEADIYIDIIDTSGRIVETLHWTDALSDANKTSTYKWTPEEVSRGLYLYKVRMSANGSKYVSKTKKLIIAR
jgi:hypothetical protein